MNEPSGMSPENGAGSPVGMDWRVVAEQRLGRLVEMEHDRAVIFDRLELLQVDYREILVANAEQLQRISGLNGERKALMDKLAELEGSRSWRVTRPLRAASTWSGAARRHASSVIHALLRIRVLRRAARIIVRLTPGLHERLRSKLRARDGLPARENLP
jgi:hypothetical protein